MAAGGRRECSEDRREPESPGNSSGDDRQPQGEGEQPVTPSHPDAGSVVSLEQSGKKKRHTAQQTQRLEAVFQECSHPDYTSRLLLSQELGLTPQQVMFWFQNRRTIVKAQRERLEKKALLEENTRRKEENSCLRAAMRNISCATCGVPSGSRVPSPEVLRLRIENVRLRAQLETLRRVAAMRQQPANGVRRPRAAPAVVQPPADVIDVSAASPPSVEKDDSLDEHSN